MGDLAGLFDSLYSRLLLRDFFGKVVPGTIVMVSVSSVSLSASDIFKYYTEASFFLVLLLIGFAWLVAFSVQVLGELTHLIKYHTYSTNQEFYELRHRFHKNTNTQEHQQLERLVVIKEACGNGYVASSLSAIFLILNLLASEGCNALINVIKLHWPSILIATLFIILLAVMHFIHVRRQDEYMNAILNVSVANG